MSNGHLFKSKACFTAGRAQEQGEQMSKVSKRARPAKEQGEHKSNCKASKRARRAQEQGEHKSKGSTRAGPA